MEYDITTSSIPIMSPILQEPSKPAISRPASPTRTTSLGVTGKLEGTHDSDQVEWRLPDFPLLFTDSSKKFYQSQSFPFAGAMWHLRIYGLGGNESLQCMISVYLLKEASASECDVSYAIGIMNSRGWVEWSGDTRTHRFGVDRGRSEIFRFFQRMELLSRQSELVQNGVLTVVCSLEKGEPLRVTSVVPDVKVDDAKMLTKTINSEEASTQTQSEYGFDELSRSMAKLVLSGDGSNVTIKVKDEQFHLHRAILGARIDFFRSMFKHDMKENTTGIVSIEDCEVEIFRTLVEYVYTGWVGPLSTDTVFELYTLADKYQVDELKSICYEFIKSTLSVDTFCDVVTLALAHFNRELLTHALDYFVLNVTDVMQTEKWANFFKENSVYANELLIKAVTKANGNKIDAER